MQSIGSKKSSKVLMVVGPSDREKVLKYGKVSAKLYKSVLGGLAQECKKYFDKLIIIPDDGVYLDFAVEFSKHGGAVLAYLPKEDVQNFASLKKNALENGFGVKQTDWSWGALNNMVIRDANFVLCLGYSSGVFIELGNIKILRKWSGKAIKLLIDERFVSQKLSKELEEDLNPIYYKSINGLGKVLELI